jgi:hypothetical protein
MNQLLRDNNKPGAMKLLIFSRWIKRFAKTRTVKNEMDLRIQMSEELWSHYEEILSDLRSKLADTRAAQGKAKHYLPQELT